MIETLSFRALPALESHLYDGWLIRYANGYTGRANSVNPVYGSQEDVHKKIRYCEAFYADKNLPTLFKLTHASQPSGLDAILEQEGYTFRENGHTHVYTAPLMTIDASYTSLEIDTQLSSDWLNAYIHMNHIAEENRQTLARLLPLIDLPCAYVSLVHDGVIVGVALGVLDEGWIGIYDVVVAAGHRRKGYARRIMMGVMAWGSQHGATQAYLQVVANNMSAILLYQSLGFGCAYDYWYRIKRADATASAAADAHTNR